MTVEEDLQALQVRVIWFDQDVTQFRVRASNGRYSGEADCYAEPGAAGNLARVLKGFPSSTSDEREFEFGSMEPGYAGGGCKLVFKTVDRRGHSEIQVAIKANSNDPGEAAFSALIDPASIDRFVEQLFGMQIAVGEEAILLGIRRS